MSLRPRPRVGPGCAGLFFLSVLTRVCGQTKDRTYQNAVLLNNSPPTKALRNKNNAASTESQKYFVYDTLLELHARFKVGHFAFGREAGGGSASAIAERPRKVLLSPNKALLLILGAYHNNRKSLVVYQIFETYPNPFHLIFYDFAFSFVDVCFSPDSRSLVCITTRHPHHLFVLALPLIECPHNKAYETSTSLFHSATAKKNAEHHVHGKDNSAFQPRSTGPVDILGPSLSALTGQPLLMSRLVSSNDASDGTFHFMTWGEGQVGEYCLWKMTRNADSGRCQFEVHPRLLAPDVVDAQWLTHPETPKTRILSASFSEAAAGKLMVVVRRERFGKSSDNGIGVQSCDVAALAGGGGFGVWYQVSDSLDGDDVVCAKWSQPLLLGKEISAAALVKKKGLFELVAHRCGSAFQANNDNFVSKCTNFAHVGRFHRYWTRDGELRALIVTPQVASTHPEWADVCRKDNSSHSNDVLGVRAMGRRIGYLIHDVQRENNPASLASVYAARRKGGAAASGGGGAGGAASGGSSGGGGKKKNANAAEAAGASGAAAGAAGAAMGHGAATAEPYVAEAEELVGLHLHRCWKCLAVLLKPLLCGRCKCAVYCSSICQAQDWEQRHAKTCGAKPPTGPPAPQQQSAIK